MNHTHALLVLLAVAVGATAVSWSSPAAEQEPRAINPRAVPSLEHGSCNPRPPIEISLVDLDGQDDALSSETMGPLRFHVSARAFGGGAPAEVVCVLSAGLELRSGALAFTDESEGGDIEVEKLIKEGQSIRVFAETASGDGGSFTAAETFGFVPPLDIDGAVHIGGFVILPSGQQ